MACFIAPGVEAIAMTVAKKQVAKKEAKGEISSENKISFSTKLSWLTKMLWGGSFLLAIEHIWHGEVVPWFPFLTAMKNPAEVGPMLMEIATVGISMALVITAVWGVMVLVSNKLEKADAGVKA